MRTLFFSIITIVFLQSAYAQNPLSIQWQKCYGGFQFEEPTDIINTTDGGLVLLARTLSSDGDVTVSYGTGDAWVVKLDNTGNIVWQKTYGGTKSDYPVRIIQLADGGYTFIGNTSSTDGTLTGTTPGYVWMARLDLNGELIWQTRHDITQQFTPLGLKLLPNGNYFVTGMGKVLGTESCPDNCYTFTSCIFDNAGQLLSVNTHFDSTYNRGMIVNPQGGYIGYGNTGGFYTPNQGSKALLVKYNNAGDSIGSSDFNSSFPGNINISYGADTDTDGTFAFAGNMYKSGETNSDSTDALFIMVDANGNRLHERQYRGNSGEELNTVIRLSDDRYLLREEQNRTVVMYGAVMVEIPKAGQS